MVSSAIKKDRLSIDVLPEMHEKIKKFATYQEKSISEYVLDSIKDRIRRDAENKHIPNEVTMQTFDDTDQGKNIFECESVEKMFNKLGL